MINEIMLVFENLSVIHIPNNEIKEFKMGKDEKFKWRLQIRNGGSKTYSPFNILPPVRILQTLTNTTIDHLVIKDKCPYKIDMSNLKQTVSLSRDDVIITLKGGENSDVK